MTLIKKMALGVLTMLFFVFIGTYIITMNNARNYFIQQLESNAQDTATSLGLSLSQSIVSRDLPTINSMVQAVFDRGYFSMIQVKNMKGAVIFSKKLAPQHSSIPKWFIKMVHWPSTEKSSLVMNGWMQAGVVSVKSDPSYVYTSLWNNAVGMVKAYLIFAAIALLLVYSFIQFLLRPLKRVTAQALAISEHEFPIETKIPKTPELKQVTLAMNQMVTKVKSLFEDQLQQAEALRKEVYQDALTGLSNRRYFIQQMSAILDNKDEFIPGYIVMIVIDGLEELNQQRGYQQGDTFILSVTRLCKDFWNRASVSTLARINGSTFALIIHEQDAAAFDKQCSEFEQVLKQGISTEPLCEAHMGTVSYFSHQTVSNLLTLVDTSIKKARELGVFYCQKEQDNLKYPRALGAEDIRQSLAQKKVILYAQAITDGKKSLHQELFVRILDPEGEEIGAGFFMPLAEKLGIAHLIDLYVLDALISRGIAADDYFALNLSEDTLASKQNSDAYLQKLKTMPKSMLNNLALEINESTVLSYFTQVKVFAKEVNKLGVKLGIDRVGIRFSPLQYLSDLHIAYLKLHGSLVQDLDENESKQFFIHYFSEMAKTMDIQVVATQVEQQGQWEALNVVNVSWGQGRYLAPVVLLGTHISL